MGTNAETCLENIEELVELRNSTQLAKNKGKEAELYLARKGSAAPPFYVFLFHLFHTKRGTTTVSL